MKPLIAMFLPVFIYSCALQTYKVSSPRNQPKYILITKNYWDNDEIEDMFHLYRKEGLIDKFERMNDSSITTFSFLLYPDDTVKLSRVIFPYDGGEFTGPGIKKFELILCAVFSGKRDTVFYKRANKTEINRFRKQKFGLRDRALWLYP